MILVDSSVWIDFLRAKETPQVARFEQLVREQQLGIGDLMLVEVLQGIPGDQAFAEVQELLARFPMVMIGGEQVALEAARNYRKLRARGVTIRKTIDTLIATRCIVDGHALLFSDRDFAPFVEHLGLRDAMG